MQLLIDGMDYYIYPLVINFNISYGGTIQRTVLQML